MNNLSKVGRTAKGITSRPLGVCLTPDEVDQVEGYAKKLERSRAWFLRFLILRGLADYKRELAFKSNLIDTFKQQQERSFHNTTLGAIIEMIAFQNELASGISASLRDTAVPHIDQTHESDAAFLRRLGKKYDAVATVKNDTLLFIPINQSRTVSGKALPGDARVRSAIQTRADAKDAIEASSVEKLIRTTSARPRRAKLPRSGSRWRIRGGLGRYAQPFESHTQGAQAPCSLPPGNKKPPRRRFLYFLAEAVRFDAKN